MPSEAMKKAETKRQRQLAEQRKAEEAKRAAKEERDQAMKELQAKHKQRIAIIADTKKTDTERLKAENDRQQVPRPLTELRSKALRDVSAERHRLAKEQVLRVQEREAWDKDKKALRQKLADLDQESSTSSSDETLRQASSASAAVSAPSAPKPPPPPPPAPAPPTKSIIDI